MDQTWKTKAACKRHEELFQEQTHQSASEGIPKEYRGVVGEAKKICFSCPVRANCYDAAMRDETYLGGTERYGIRGGATARERVLVAAEDPMCARCRVEPVVEWERVIHIRRLCRKCQLNFVDKPEGKYFPDVLDNVI